MVRRAMLTDLDNHFRPTRICRIANATTDIILHKIRISCRGVSLNIHYIRCNKSRRFKLGLILKASVNTVINFLVP
jgi:riboflavin synthase alpha subunit